MKNINKIVSYINYFAAIGFYVASIIGHFTDSSMSTTYLCLGSAFLCIGSCNYALSKNKADQNNNKNNEQ